MSRVEEIPRVLDDRIAVVAGGVAGIAAIEVAGYPETEAIFDKHQADIAHDKISGLKDEIHSLKATRVQFDGANPVLRADVDHYIDGKVASENGQIRAISASSPTFGLAQRSEQLGIVLGETVGAVLLAAYAIHKVHNALIRRNARR